MSQPEDISRRPSSQSLDSTAEDARADPQPIGSRPDGPQHNRPVVDTSNRNRHSESPGSTIRPSRYEGAPGLAEAETETRRLARSHYENFLVASILLPRGLRQPFYNIYAFCRTADDLADESESCERALERLKAFQQELDAAVGGRPSGSLFLALAHTMDQFQLSRQPFDDLLDAFRQDQVKTRYETFGELLDYCRRSANPVGRIVLELVGAGGHQAVLASDQICTGLQLANFLQDVSLDYQKGRIYLAEDQMRRFGVDESMFERDRTQTPLPTPAPLRELLSFECDRAESFLQRGLPLADQVPRWFAADVRLFAHGGMAALRAIRRVDFDVLRVRPVVSRRTQIWLLTRAALGML